MKEKGQSLLEALIALGAAAIVISAIAVAVISSVNNSDYSKYLNLATAYSQQGVEILKQQSVSDWTTFSGYASGALYCFPQGTVLTLASGVSCSPNIGTGNFFVRTAVITQASPSCPANPPVNPTNGTLVSVETSWTDGKCTSPSNVYCHNSTFNTCITDVNRVSAP